MTPADGTGVRSVDYAPVRAVLEARSATAFVHVGESDDAVLQYLARTRGLDGELAVCVTPEQALLFAPADPTGAAEAFPGDRVLPGGGGVPTGERLASALDDLGRSGTVVTPRTVPHDAALYLESWDFEVASTDVVGRARMAKSDAERLRVRTVQAGADAAVARARTVLGESEIHDGEHLQFADRAVTTETLRREVASSLAAAGVAPGTVAVGAGGPATPRSDAAIRPGEPVVVAIAPQGREGYHGHLVRTLVPDADGGWTRRAQLAATGAIDAALDALGLRVANNGGDDAGAKNSGDDAGDRAADGAADGAADDVTVATVEREGTAELTAYGFDDIEGEFAVHGVGLQAHEAPSEDATVIPPGAVLALDASVSGPAGVVRLADLVVMTEEGAERVGTAPHSLTP